MYGLPSANRAFPIDALFAVPIFSESGTRCRFFPHTAFLNCMEYCDIRRYLEKNVKLLERYREKRMKLGVSTYSWLWSQTVEDAVRILGDNGIRRVEFSISPPHFNLDAYRPGSYRKLRKVMDEYGMEAVSVNIPSMDINIASPFPEMRRMTVGLYKRLALVAAELNAKIMIIPPGKRHPLLPPDYNLIYSYAKDSICQLADHIQDTDLIIGVETLPSLFIDTTTQLKTLVNDIASEHVKIVYDAANVFGLEDPAETLKEVREELCLLHLSDTKRSKWEHNILGTGELDSKAFIDAAKAIGYDGHLVLEVISSDGIGGILHSIDTLKRHGLLD